MPVSMNLPKNNQPRAKWSERFGLPRPAVASHRAWWRRPGALVANWRTFWAAGWRALDAREDALIHDKDYEPRLRATLGEYLNWYFSDKAFLHSIDWMGIPTRKLVTDMWVYQEIIAETRPDLIIEIGAFYGGSTLFLAQMQEFAGGGQVLSIDVSHAHFRARHPGIVTLTADCSDPAALAQARALAADRRVMVIHDGDHSAAAVARDLRLYAPLVTPGMYLVVEDGVVDLLNPRHSKFGRAYPQGGPLRATREVMDTMDDLFELDMRRERFILTSNPRGYWRRRATPAQA